jgi:hypothetical protein
MLAVFARVAFAQVVFGQAAPTVAAPIEAPMCAVAWEPLPLVPPPSVATITIGDVDIIQTRPAIELTL